MSEAIETSPEKLKKGNRSKSKTDRTFLVRAHKKWKAHSVAGLVCFVSSDFSVVTRGLFQLTIAPSEILIARTLPDLICHVSRNFWKWNFYCPFLIAKLNEAKCKLHLMQRFLLTGSLLGCGRAHAVQKQRRSDRAVCNHDDSNLLQVATPTRPGPRRRKIQVWNAIQKIKRGSWRAFCGKIIQKRCWSKMLNVFAVNWPNLSGMWYNQKTTNFTKWKKQFPPNLFSARRFCHCF